MKPEVAARKREMIEAPPPSAPSFDVLEGVVEDVAAPSGRLEKGARTPPTIEVRVAGRSLEARRAASCLLAPAPGDRVLVASGGSAVFVIAVLERGEADVDAIELGRGVALDVDADRSVRVRGATNLELCASEVITATSPEVRVRAERASVIAKKVEAIGASVESSFDQVRQFGRILEVVADEVSTRVKRSLRIVSELDQTRANAVEIRAEGVVTIHGENTAVTARQVAKIDSNQIHIG